MNPGKLRSKASYNASGSEPIRSLSFKTLPGTAPGYLPNQLFPRWPNGMMTEGASLGGGLV